MDGLLYITKTNLDKVVAMLNRKIEAAKLKGYSFRVTSKVFSNNKTKKHRSLVVGRGQRESGTLTLFIEEKLTTGWPTSYIFDIGGDDNLIHMKWGDREFRIADEHSSLHVKYVK